MFVLPVFVALKVGTLAATGLLKASFKLIVMVEVATPLATTGLVPEILELAATGRPALKTTVLPDFKTGFVILSTFDSAFVEERLHEETPLASDIEQAI